MRQVLKWIVGGGVALVALAACSTSDEAATAPDGARPVESAPPPASEPPPAPAPAKRMRAEGASESRAASPTADAVAEVSMPPTEPGREQPVPQAGLLTAGDYDDVLNPGLYKIYLDKVLQGELQGRDLPYVDANRRIAIRVTDRLGKPVPLASITVKSADGETAFPLRTGANGLAYIYPQYDALEAGMTVSVRAGEGKAAAKTLTGQQIENGGELAFDLGSDRAAAKQMDLLLTIDATGSMGDEMNYLKEELQGILDRVANANPGLDIRVGLIVYRDTGDEYVVRDFPFTSDIGDLKSKLAAQRADGGGDTPEAMQTAMSKSLDFKWRDDAIKVNLLLADAPPHDPDVAATWKTALISRTRGIHIVPVAASGVDKTAEFLMRAMAQITGGRYVFLTDDSGIGNPHAEPTVDCYVVTRLDSMVTRVLTSLVKGERVEPNGDEVIRTVGSYRAGVCKVEELAGQ
jgi:Mg-chelatase subunit ChlD